MVVEGKAVVDREEEDVVKGSRGMPMPWRSGY